MSVRGLKAALNSNGRFKYKAPEWTVDHLVIGGGVVGLAVAQRLAQRFPEKSTYVVERHSRAGEEISSRNSEVVHAGLYYPPGSLKENLCIRGRELMYERCNKYGIPHRKTGKLVVAHEHQRSYIENLHAKALKMKWPEHTPLRETRTDSALPTELVSGDRARELEPDLSADVTAALLSHETGIVDSHSLMESFEKDIVETEGGALAYSTAVVRLDPYVPSEIAPELDAYGWVVQTVTGDTGDGDAVLARTLINASGLSAHFIFNSLVPKEDRVPLFYGRGSYASYKGPGTSRIQRLIYPCPDTGTGRTTHGFQSLGTHLTLDLQGHIRFGPDLEWIEPPSEDDEAFENFWRSHLVPNESRLRDMHAAITSYLPNVTFEGLQPDYVGVRPKLVGPQGGFHDFTIRKNYPSDFTGKGRRRGPMVNLLGIESPGLTSSMAIAECVVEDVLQGDL